MTSPDNKAIIRQLVEEVVNTGNPDVVEKFISPNYIDHNAGVNDAQGIEGYQQHLAAVRTTYGDFHLTIERQIAEGDMVMTQVVATGIHQTEWLGLKPTGRLVTITGVNIDRLVDGKIVEHWSEANTIGALFQMGAKIVQGEVDSQ